MGLERVVAQSAPQKRYEFLLSRINNGTIKETLRAHVELELTGLPVDSVKALYFRNMRAYAVAKSFLIANYAIPNRGELMLEKFQELKCSGISKYTEFYMKLQNLRRQLNRVDPSLMSDQAFFLTYKHGLTASMLQKAMLESDYEDHTQDIDWFHSFFQKQERANRISSGLTKTQRAGLNSIKVEQIDEDDSADTAAPDTTTNNALEGIDAKFHNILFAAAKAVHISGGSRGEISPGIGEDEYFYRIERVLVRWVAFFRDGTGLIIAAW